MTFSDLLLGFSILCFALILGCGLVGLFRAGYNRGYDDALNDLDEAERGIQARMRR
jgi:hypothetical protein